VATPPGNAVQLSGPDPVGHLVGVAAVLEPGQQRLGQPILLGGAKALQRAEPGRPQGAGQLLVGEDEQGGQVLVAAHQVLAAVDDAPGGEAERQPRPAQRRGGPGQRNTMAVIGVSGSATRSMNVSTACRTARVSAPA